MIEWVGSLLSPVSLTYIMDGRETQLILTARKLTHLSPHSARLPFLSVSHSSLITSLHSVPPADESMMRQRKGKEIREGPLVSRFSRTLTSHAVRSSGMSLPSFHSLICRVQEIERHGMARDKESLLSPKPVPNR